MTDGERTLSFISRAPGIVIENNEVDVVSPTIETDYRYNPEDFYWESPGSPFKILRQAGVLALQKMTLLIVICLDVTQNSDHVQECSPDVLIGPWPFGEACYCSFTKGFVECFPLLAILLTVTITAKQMIFKRVFYQTLKRGGLIIFENFNFHQDPDYMLMVFSYCMVVLHFVQLLYNSAYHDLHQSGSLMKMIRNETTSRTRVDDAITVVPFYIMPGFMWWGIFVGAYDHARLSLPLLKFFQKEPAEMQSFISEAKIMKEDIAAWVLQHHRVALREATDTESLYKAWINESARLSADAAEAAHMIKAPVFNRWRMMQDWWPRRILFASRLNDVDSLEFRLLFLPVIVVCIIVFFVVAYFLGIDLIYLLNLIFYKKQFYHIPHIVVLLFFACYGLRVFTKILLRTGFLEYGLEASSKVDDYAKVKMDEAKDAGELAWLLEPRTDRNV